MDKFCFSVEKNSSSLRSPTLQSSFTFDYLLHYIFHNSNLTVTLGVVWPGPQYNTILFTSLEVTIIVGQLLYGPMVSQCFP